MSGASTDSICAETNAICKRINLRMSVMSLNN